MMSDSLNIYSFQDYRELIGALIQERKKNRQVFSYRWFSQKAGLLAPNFLHLVVRGKRHLSNDITEKVIQIFQLNKSQGEFFRSLVKFNKAKTLSEKEHYAMQLIKLKKFQNEFPLSQEQFEYYSKWYHIPIRELLNLKNPPQTKEEVAELLTPYVSAVEVQSAFDKLKKLGMIRQTPAGWQPEHENVATGNKFSSYGVVQYHKKMLELAGSSLDRFGASEREISSVTLGLSAENFIKIKKMVEEFRSQLMSIAEEDLEKEQIYQINFQLFPLSKTRAVKRNRSGS